MTITGIGNVTGAAIISEIGDIPKFDSPRKLVAFAGLDAAVTQSGEFEATHNVMSKRGSPYLRKAIFQATLIASFKDHCIKRLLPEKESRGQTPFDMRWRCYQKNVQHYLCCPENQPALCPKSLNHGSPTKACLTAGLVVVLFFLS